MTALLHMLTSAGYVLVAGLVFGAGVPAVFALGIRLWNAASATTSADGSTVRRGSPAAMAGAIVCLLVVVAVVVLGILLITGKTMKHYFGWGLLA